MQTSLAMANLTSIPLGCITPNPDIAGIGVRVSVYIQNIMAIATTAWAMSDNKLTASEREEISGQTTTMILTIGALFVAAFVQATNYGMSTYHALIVINLGWVNTASLLLNECLARIPRAEPIKHTRDALSRAATLLSFISAVSSIVLFSAFGVWFWATVDTFGPVPSSQCAARLPIPIRILGHTVPMTSPVARKVFLAFYSASAMFFALLLVLSLYYFCTQGTVSTDDEAPPLTKSRTVRFWIKMVVISGFSVGMIVSTESTIHELAPFVQQGESQWTFGQTVAVLVLVPSALGILGTIAKEKEVKEGCDLSGTDSNTKKSLLLGRYGQAMELQA